jgi:hypothetical protein
LATLLDNWRPRVRGEKLVCLQAQGKPFQYRQPGWWCSLEDPNDLEGELVDEDNPVAEMARRTAQSAGSGEYRRPRP